MSERHPGTAETDPDDDEFVYTTEYASADDVRAFNAFLALPVREGVSFYELVGDSDEDERPTREAG